MNRNLKEYAIQLKALSDPTRLRIIEILSCGELCACDILESFQITQPTLSYHMKALIESGLVIGKKRGSWMRYRLNAESLEALSAFIGEISHGDDSCVCNESPLSGCSCVSLEKSGFIEEINGEQE